MYQLGNVEKHPCSTPTIVTKNISKEFIIDIACGGSHSLALTREGDV